MRRFTVSLAGLSLWAGMGAHADRTTATLTRGVGTGARVYWVPAALTLGAGTVNGWASTIPTGETDTGAGTSGASAEPQTPSPKALVRVQGKAGALLPWGRDKQRSRSSLYIVQNRYIYTGRVYVSLWEATRG